MELNTIQPADGAKHAKRRVGRGIGSGLGKSDNEVNISPFLIAERGINYHRLVFYSLIDFWS